MTLAVERLFVIQPPVSYALTRPRELLDGALFTRTHDGIQPTFAAEQLYDTFRESLMHIEGAVQSVRHFDSATIERRFRIVLINLDEMGFLSLALEHLAHGAPLAGVEMLPLQMGEVGAWLNSAKVDMVTCRQPVPDARSQRVPHERYVCLFNDRHPWISDSLSLEQYLTEQHIVVTRTPGRGVAEDMLEATQTQCRISLRVPHFSVLSKIIPGAELLTILPVQVAYRFITEGGMRMLELPFTLPPSNVSLY